MGDYRGRGAEWLLKLRLSGAAGLVHNFGRAPLLCLAYHRVLPIPDPARFPFDLELISASPEEFERQMAYLRANFDPIPLSAVVEHLETGAKLPRRPAVVTFDDGFDDNLHHAEHALRSNGIVPTIFLATSMVGAPHPYWFEMAVYLMMRLPVGSLEVAGEPRRLPFADDVKARRESGSKLQRVLMMMPDATRAALLTRWQSEFSAHVDRAEFVGSRILDWTTIRRMASSGYEFGSHTITHSLLSALDVATLDDELSTSRATIERELGRPIKTLAYPIGKEFAYNAQVKDSARRAGYAFAVAYTAGINWLGALDLFAMRRQNIERGHSLDRFKALTQFPRWVHW